MMVFDINSSDRMIDASCRLPLAFPAANGLTESGIEAESGSAIFIYQDALILVFICSIVAIQPKPTLGGPTRPSPHATASAARTLEASQRIRLCKSGTIIGCRIWVHNAGPMRSPPVTVAIAPSRAETR